MFFHFEYQKVSISVPLFTLVLVASLDKEGVKTAVIVVVASCGRQCG